MCNMMHIGRPTSPTRRQGAGHPPPPPPPPPPLRKLSWPLQTLICKAPVCMPHARRSSAAMRRAMPAAVKSVGRRTRAPHAATLALSSAKCQAMTRSIARRSSCLPLRPDCAAARTPWACRSAAGHPALHPVQMKLARPTTRLGAYTQPIVQVVNQAGVIRMLCCCARYSIATSSQSPLSRTAHNA